MRVEVKAESVTLREGVARATQKPYSFREQTAWVDLGRAYPSEVRFVLGDRQQPFPPGWYEAGPDCYTVDRNFNLTVDLRKMRPAKPAAAVKAV